VYAIGLFLCIITDMSLVLGYLIVFTPVWVLTGLSDSEWLRLAAACRRARKQLWSVGKSVASIVHRSQESQATGHEWRYDWGAPGAPFFDDEDIPLRCSWDWHYDTPTPVCDWGACGVPLCEVACVSSVQRWTLRGVTTSCSAVLVVVPPCSAALRLWRRFRWSS
jgi:hypothetical protein